MQHKVECFHRRPATIVGHIIKGLDGLVYKTTHIAIGLNNSAKEVVRQTAFAFGFDPGHDIVNGVKEAGLGKLVDDQSVKSFIGFVVFALGVVVQGCADRVGVSEGCEDFQDFIWG